MIFVDSCDETGVISTDIKDIGRFSVKETLNCGQCFRWVEQIDGSFTGIVDGKVLNISNVLNNKGEKVLRILGVSPDFAQDYLAKYLDLYTNYDDICERLAQKDEHLKRAIEYAGGIRLLKQPLVETILSFIISANNNVPRIMGIIERISRKFGKKCDAPVWIAETKYSFPTLDELAQATKEDFLEVGAGYRAEYLVQTIKLLQELSANHIDGLNGWQDNLQAMSLDEARKEMLKLCGVGPKVADCILLFSGINMRAFPTDVWVKRVMTLLYFDCESTPGSSIKNVMNFADEHFGELAGYAQQYLFHYARMNKLGIN